MPSKKGLSKGPHLYAIIDRGLTGNKILKTAEMALSAGADMLQLRDKSSSQKEIFKTARVIKIIAKRYGVPFIINDRLDVAIAVDADGLHIGQGDIRISLAKKFMKKGKLVGVTVKNIKQAVRAKREGASYIGVGPIFKTPIKSGVKPKGFALLNEVKRLNIPFFAIGGIDCENIYKLAKMGFKNIAAIRAICQARDPYAAVRNLKEAIIIK